MWMSFAVRSALAPKSKGHIRSVMHILFEWAMRWELLEYNWNQMSLMKLKGLTRPVRQPRGAIG
jgi:hypothetical protein